MTVTLAIAVVAIIFNLITVAHLYRRRRRRRCVESTTASWACPGCGNDIPVTLTPHQAVWVDVDTTDVEAHQLTCQEAS